jgi:DNA-binding PadR family transcriptional regulator
VIGDFWSLTLSQVYRELTAMASDGLVKAGAPGQRGSVRYDLTAAGRDAFARWLSTSPGAEHIRFPLLLTIEFGRHLPSEVLARFVRDHRAAHVSRLAGYERLHREMTDSENADLYAMATLEFGISYERAVLAWFEALPPEIQGTTNVETQDS